MSTSLSDVESEALKLPLADRALLADHLLASVYADREVDDAWVEEIERRIHEAETGRSAAMPIDEAIARARRNLE